MPGLCAGFLRQLLDAAVRSDAAVLVPASPSGRLEPLCAVYHRSSRQGLHAAFTRGVRKASAALEEVRCLVWPVPEASYFQNVNTPEDWAPHGQ